MNLAATFLTALGQVAVKKECLPQRFLGQGRRDLFELRLESHVQHPVGFVQHHEVAPLQCQARRFAIQQIAETTGRRDHDLWGHLAQFLYLGAGVGPAVDAARSDPNGRPEFSALPVDLDGQFARW